MLWVIALFILLCFVDEQRKHIFTDLVKTTQKISRLKRKCSIVYVFVSYEEIYIEHRLNRWFVQAQTMLNQMNKINSADEDVFF